MGFWTVSRKLEVGTLSHVYALCIPWHVKWTTSLMTNGRIPQEDTGVSTVMWLAIQCAAEMRGKGVFAMLANQTNYYVWDCGPK